MFFLLLEVIPRWGLRNPVSMMSHLLGAVLGVAALAALLWRAQRRGADSRAVWALAVYGVSMTLGFAASALFHTPMVSAEELAVFKKLDHAGIFVMIAGTGTALCGALRTRWAGPMTVALWAVCLGAIAIKMVVWPMPLWLTALMYVAVGWCTLIGLFVIVRAIGWRRIQPLFWGAAVLTLGAAVFALRWPILWPGVVEGHEVFHMLALIGASIHFAFIYESCTAPEGLVAAGVA